MYAVPILSDFAVVYPCVYREHLHIVIPELERDGLSLCIQGTSRCNYIYMFCNRFIPVYTGNIGTSALDFVNSAVYPCVYREHSYLSETLII